MIYKILPPFQPPVDLEIYPTLRSLPDPFSLPGMLDVCEQLETAILDHTPILIHGDYDCDGVCASAILMLALQHLGADVLVHLPDREHDGYGLRADRCVDRLPPGGVVVTVDCGVAQPEQVRALLAAGHPVIVTDHHAYDAEPPCPWLHPARSVAHAGLCGAGVAWFLAWALLRRAGTGKDLLSDLLTHAAVATVADVVPLRGVNRLLVREGIRHKSSFPGLAYLMEGRTRASDVAFQVAPRVNAAGRLRGPDMAFRCLTSRDRRVAVAAAEELDACNRERREVEKEILEQIGANPAPVVSGDWHPGVVGIIAGKLCERTGLPSVVVSTRSDPCAGSARAPEGFDVRGALAECSDVLERSGGHARAAGCNVQYAKLGEFRKRFAEIVARAEIPEAVTDVHEISLGEVDPALMSVLDALEPTGEGNPAPLFCCAAEVADRREVRGGHQRLTLRDGTGTRTAMWFYPGKGKGEGGERVVFQPQWNEWNGMKSIQLLVKGWV